LYTSTLCLGDSKLEKDAELLRNSFIQLPVRKAKVSNVHSNKAPVSQIVLGRLLSAVVANDLLELAVCCA
jgi:hypothetical protein